MQTSTSRAIKIYQFGQELVEYSRALALQGQLAEAVSRGAQDALLVLQHPPVYTLGKRGQQRDFKTSQEELQRLGAKIFTVPRGGEVTFHGPGQLVAYPVVQLRRLRLGARVYVESLEDTVVDVAANYGIRAEGRQKGRTGVWVADRKLAAIGVKISQGICTHGLALNATNDLSWFQHIVPCGVLDRGVTSIQEETQASVDLSEVADALISSFVKQCRYTKEIACKPAELI